MRPHLLRAFDGRRWLALGFACITLLAACGDAPEWRDLVISEGAFAVLMRAEPRYVRQDIDTPAGKMTAHLYSSDRPNSYYAVGYVDYPLALVTGAPPDQIFANVRETWLRRVQGKAVGPNESLKLDGKYPGIQFSAEGTRTRDGKASEKGTAERPVATFLEARLYLVDQRLYQVIAMGRKGEVPQGEVNRYLRSFRLVEQSEVGSIKIEPKGK